MLGVPETGENSREAVCVVDARTAERVQRAARRHLRTAPQTRSVVATWALVLAGGPVIWAVLGDGLTLQTGLVACFMLPVGFLLATALVAFSSELNLRTIVREEFQPGRMLGLTIGSQSMRVRDHNSSNAFTYDVVRLVEVHGDVVVVGCRDRFFLLPMELFDAASLSLLRDRTARPPSALRSSG